MAEKWAKERELEGRKFDHRREGFYEYMEFRHFPAIGCHREIGRGCTETGVSP